MKPFAYGAIALVLLVLLGFQSCQLSQERGRLRDSVLRADSIEAAADSTRGVSENALKALHSLFGDSVAAVERRVVQERQRGDALDRALGRERIARAGLTVTVDSLRVAVQAPVTSDTGDQVRSAWFPVSEVAFTGEAAVSLPRPPASGTLDLQITVRPIPLHLRLGCGAPVNGLRPATAVLAGPSWTTLTLDSLSQDPGLCRSPILEQRVSRLKWMGIGAGLVVVVRELVNLVRPPRE